MSRAALILSVALALAAGRANALEGKPCGPDAIHTWTGSGMQTTRPFHMPGPWEIQWGFPDAKSGLFQVFVHQPGQEDDFPSSIAANQMDGSAGSTYREQGGDYFLTINAVGFHWKVCIVSVEGDQKR